MNRTTRSPQETGRVGEDAAADFLRERGCEILARNWRAGRAGEIDLIVRDDTVVVFVEVKTRNGRLVAAEEAVTDEKLARIQTVALAWLSRNGFPGPIRFDIVGVYLLSTGQTQINWLQDVAQ